MTFQRPIFSKGLFGKANRMVCNGWTQAAAVTQDNAQGIEWAQRQIVRGNIIAQGLCTVLSAAAWSGATNRWLYTVKLWVPDPYVAGGIAQPNDDRFSYTNCANLREWHNVAGVADCMDLTTPLAEIGPVGSRYTGGAWPTTNLEAKVHVCVVYDRKGLHFPYFDRPNPIRCL
jgi:hypothetical protein